MASERSGSVQSVGRAFEILEQLAAADGVMGLSELAERLQLPVPTVHRLMRTLVGFGYARQLPSRQYALGPRLIQLGAVATKTTGAWAQPILDGLVRQLGETVNLASLESDKMIYVAQAPSPHAMRMFTEVGRRVYCHCTGVGKSVLATLPEERVRAIIGRVGMPPQTSHSIADVDSLLEELAAIRRRGYAIDEGEQEVGVRCFAVAVPNAAVPTALSVSGPAVRVTTEMGTRAIPLLQAAARQLAAELSGS
ncbi:MAG: IclR family transcriptional regulator [Propionibacteriaceae bacterium]|jgi:IclR family acetate operon transcriptional repressor|nr:IclR family transcriptional regulator [Propionibacteriaceae bacterium]